MYNEEFHTELLMHKSVISLHCGVEGLIIKKRYNEEAQYILSLSN